MSGSLSELGDFSGRPAEISGDPGDRLDELWLAMFVGSGRPVPVQQPGEVLVVGRHDNVVGAGMGTESVAQGLIMLEVRLPQALDRTAWADLVAKTARSGRMRWYI